ncbi:MAG: sigma-70 family RNA polymerase sigma factor [Candidatus Acidiferrales bacterium]
MGTLYMEIARVWRIRESFSPDDRSNVHEGGPNREHDRPPVMDELNKINDREDPEDDLAIVERVLIGDRQAFESLVRKHERRVFRVTLAVTGNFEDAEEAMQNVFVKVFRHLDQFRKEARFTTWLTRIAVNEALQIRQGRKNLVSLDEPDSSGDREWPHRIECWRDDPEELCGKEELRRIVEEAVQSLPDIYREVFVLRDIEGLSAEEAATALELEIPALKSRLLRARLMMREKLAQKFEQAPSLKSKVADAASQLRLAAAMGMSMVSRRKGGL